MRLGIVRCTVTSFDATLDIIRCGLQFSIRPVYRNSDHIGSDGLNYPYRNDKTGEWTDEPYWNRVTIFSDGIRTYIDRNASIGDLVRVEGRMRDSSYEKDGETIYTVDRIANEFGILASKAEAQG